MLRAGKQKLNFCHIIFIYLKKGKNTSLIALKICTVYRQSVVSDNKGRRWFKKLKLPEISIANLMLDLEDTHL